MHRLIRLRSTGNDCDPVPLSDMCNDKTSQGRIPRRRTKMFKFRLLRLRFAACAALVLVITLHAPSARADAVSDWNKIMNDTVLAAGTNPLLTSRVVAIVGASVFD